MDETHQLWSDGITRRKNLTFVKGLCRHLEMKSEASVAKLAGAGWRCGAQSAARSCLQPRTAAPGRAGSDLCWVSGREERQASLWSSPIHREASGSMCLRSRNFGPHPSHHTSLISTITTPRPLKCWQAPSSTQGSWPLLQLSWLRTPILFSGNLNKQGPLKKTKLRLWIPPHSREILKP